MYERCLASKLGGMQNARVALPGKAHISKSLFYTIVKHITGGGKQQEARAGVDYIKVNFHIDNFIIVDKVIDALAPPSDIDQTLRNELCGLRKDVYTFLSYGYALHAREGVKSSEIHDNMEHQSQEHEALQFKAYQETRKQENDQQILHFFDCIVQGEQKCDSNIVLSCFEAALHALRCQFPHVKKLIIQSDNARNLAGKQTKLLLPHVCSAAGFKLVAYYHNEAQSGKDVCDTHFSHQQTHLEAYLKHGDGGRKISTPKQLAVALMEKSITNTTVLLIKPNFTAPHRSATCPSINGITQFYAAKYTTTVLNQQTVLFYNCLGQSIPSLCVNVPSCHAFSLITPMGEYGINFTGVTVLLNSDSDDASTKVRVVKNRYAKRATCSSNKELQRMEERQEYEETMRQIRAVYPQCSQCFYHYKSQKLLDKRLWWRAAMRKLEFHSRSSTLQRTFLYGRSLN